MNSTKSSTLLDWILFAVSLVIMIMFLMWLPEWFWLALPFVLTYLTRALRSM